MKSYSRGNIITAKIISEEQMKNKKNFFEKAAWLLGGMVLWYMAGGDQPVGLAVWMAPALILRCFRDMGPFRGFLIILPSLVLVEIFSDKGMVPFPSFKMILIYTGIGMVFTLIPYLIDSLIRKRLPKWMKLLFFPSLAIAIPFLLKANGAWGARANGIDDLAFLQLVSVTGMSGISFVIYWTATLLNEAWEHRKRMNEIKFQILAFAMVLILIYGFGTARLRTSGEGTDFIQAAGVVHDADLRKELMNGYQRLLSVKPGDETALSDVRVSMKGLFNRFLSKSLSLGDAGAELAVWGEGSALIFEEDEEELINLAARAAKEKKIMIGIGVAVLQKNDKPEDGQISPLFRNKLILVSSEGEIVWEYSKGILVPGMEEAITIPGDKRMKIDKAQQMITGAICYELDFPRYIRQASHLKAGLILGPSNDWKEIKNIHSRMARLRAIETGVSLFRPTNGGISVAVDPFGRILSSVDHDRYPGSHIIATLPTESVFTIYGLFGDFFGWLCLFLLALSIISLLVQKFKK